MENVQTYLTRWNCYLNYKSSDELEGHRIKWTNERTGVKDRFIQTNSRTSLAGEIHECSSDMSQRARFALMTKTKPTSATRRNEWTLS